MSETILQEGAKAPAFSALANNNEKVTLSNFKGQWLVLYFYPKDDTPGCTVESCGFRDTFKDFKKENAVILGVSPDGVESHQKFIKKFDLPFLLLADTEKKMCEDYGVWKQKSMFGKKYMGIERSTFLINPEGQISKVWRKVKVSGHWDEVLEAITDSESQ
jgi:thioredoxin-dependent peroxiredoxin